MNFFCFYVDRLYEAYMFIHFLQSLLFAHKVHEYNFIHDFYTFADVKIKIYADKCCFFMIVLIF